MRPQAQHLHHVHGLQHLVDQPVLDVDASGIGASQIADQLFIRRRILKWVVAQDVQQRLGFGFKAAGGELLRVFFACLANTTSQGFISPAP